MADPATDTSALDPSIRAFLSGVAGGNAPVSAPTPAAGNVVPLPASGGSVKDRVRQEWLNAGYPPAAVDGILRRVQVESSFDPHSIGDGGTSFGLYQHHQDRAAKLYQYAQKTQQDPGDPVTQTRYAIAEMNGLDSIAAKAKPALMQSTDPKAAYGLFTSSFERPAGAVGSEDTNLRATAAGPFNANAQSILNTLQGDIARRGQELDSALVEAKDLRTASRLQIEKWSLQSEKPPQNAHEAWQQWSVPAIALAAFGGFFGRNHSAAINAAGVMLQSANEADSKTYDLAYKKWRDHLADGLKLGELLNSEARDIVSDARTSYDSKITQLSTLSTMYQLQQHLDPHSVENLSKNIELLRQRSDLIKAQNEDSERRLAVSEADQKWLADHPEARAVPANIHLEHEGQARREAAGTFAKPSQAKEIEVTGSDGKVVRRGAAYQGADNQWYWIGSNEAVDVPPGANVNLKSTQQPRSASGLAVQRYIEENPDAKSADIAQFNAEYTRLGALDRDFASGPDGRNLISLNTVADHIPLFRKYAAALNSGSTQAANAALNEIQRQLGRPDITNFDLARDFLADEVARVLVPGGAGALADREAMKERLKSSMSPQQLAGGADVATNFIRGKLEALRQQYGRGDEKRESYFNTKMLTPGAREMFGQSSSSAVDISKAGLDDLLKIIDQPGLTADQRRQIDERLKALGH